MEKYVIKKLYNPKTNEYEDYNYPVKVNDKGVRFEYVSETSEGYAIARLVSEDEYEYESSKYVIVDKNLNIVSDVLDLPGNKNDKILEHAHFTGVGEGLVYNNKQIAFTPMSSGVFEARVGRTGEKGYYTTNILFSKSGKGMVVSSGLGNIKSATVGQIKLAMKCFDKPDVVLKCFKNRNNAQKFFKDLDLLKTFSNSDRTFEYIEFYNDIIEHSKNLTEQIKNTNGKGM